MAERLEQGDRGPVRFRLRAADGSWRSVETIMSDMTADPAVGGLVVTTRDVSDRTRAEALVADQAEILKLIARGAPLTETVTAICGVLERHVDAAAFGMLLIDAADERLRLVASPQVPSELVDCCGDLSVAEAEALFGGPLDEIGELLDLRANPMPVLLHAVTDTGVGGLRPTPILDTGTGRVIGVIVAFVAEPEPARAADDAVVEMFAQTAAIAIERRAAEDLLAHRANHDSLTGLPNRVLFLEFLSLALARTQRDENTLAVLFLDLDRFKHINDGLGHDAGDVLLAQLAGAPPGRDAAERRGGALRWRRVHGALRRSGPDRCGRAGP